MFKYLLLCILAVCAGAAVGQTMYRYTDAAGNAVYSDQPPPAGVPYTVQKMPPGKAAQPGVPAVAPGAPLPYPATQAPETLTGRGPVDPDAGRDRRAFVPEGERSTRRADAERNVPLDDEARRADDVQRRVPADEAARQREAVGINVPAGEDARIRSDMQTNVPSDEASREAESIRLNR
jgi:hypothetical protein